MALLTTVRPKRWYPQQPFGNLNPMRNRGPIGNPPISIGGTFRNLGSGLFGGATPKPVSSGGQFRKVKI